MNSIFWRPILLGLSLNYNVKKIEFLISTNNRNRESFGRSLSLIFFVIWIERTQSNAFQLLFSMDKRDLTPSCSTIFLTARIRSKRWSDLLLPSCFCTNNCSRPLVKPPCKMLFIRTGIYDKKDISGFDISILKRAL